MITNRSHLSPSRALAYVEKLEELAEEETPNVSITDFEDGIRIERNKKDDGFISYYIYFRGKKEKKNNGNH